MMCRFSNVCLLLLLLLLALCPEQLGMLLAQLLILGNLLRSHRQVGALRLEAVLAGHICDLVCVAVVTDKAEVTLLLDAASLRLRSRVHLTLLGHGLAVILFVAVLVVSSIGVLFELLADDVNLRLVVSGVLILVLLLGSSHGCSHQAGNDTQLHLCLVG